VAIEEVEHLVEAQQKRRACRTEWLTAWSRLTLAFPASWAREVNPRRLAPKLGVADEDSDIGLW